MSAAGSARDRAIEIIAAASKETDTSAAALNAWAAVDALLARPEVLRALAGEAGAADLDRLRDVFEQAGEGERAWGAHYAAMVIRGQLAVEHVPTGPKLAVITGAYRAAGVAPDS